MSNIESILEDLYLADPTLKEHEAELKKLVEKLLEVKPDIQMDEVFVDGLRRQLSAKSEEITDKNPKKFGWMNFMYTFGGVAVMLVIVVTIFYQNNVGIPVGEQIIEEANVETQDLASPEFDDETIEEEQSAISSPPSAKSVRTMPSIPAPTPAVEEVESLTIEPMSTGAGGGIDRSDSAEPEAAEAMAPEASFMMDDYDEGEEEIADEAFGYYADLREGCSVQSEFDCCLSSIDQMETGGYELIPQEGCPEGYIINKLECVGSLEWCELE